MPVMFCSLRTWHTIPVCSVHYVHDTWYRYVLFITYMTHDTGMFCSLRTWHRIPMCHVCNEQNITGIMCHVRNEQNITGIMCHVCNEQNIPVSCVVHMIPVCSVHYVHDTWYQYVLFITYMTHDTGMFCSLHTWHMIPDRYHVSYT
jgi:hypothetical protein